MLGALKLLFAKRPEGTAAPPSSGQPSGTPSTTVLTGFRVLLVDGGRLFSEALEQALTLHCGAGGNPHNVQQSWCNVQQVHAFH